MRVIRRELADSEKRAAVEFYLGPREVIEYLEVEGVDEDGCVERYAIILTGEGEAFSWFVDAISQTHPCPVEAARLDYLFREKAS